MNKATKIVTLLLIISSITTQSLNITNSINDIDDATSFKNFQTFYKNHKKTYNSIGDIYNKFNAYKQNLIKQKELQQQLIAENSDPHTIGETQFMDLTPEEFASQYLTLNITELEKIKSEASFEDFNDPPEATESQTNLKLDNPEETNTQDNDEDTTITPEQNNNSDSQVDKKGRNLQGSVPTSFDWRTHGAVTPVKNQKTCGDCWAFAAVANIEGQYFNKYKILKTFSEQQILDCNLYGGSCNGGTATMGFSYVKSVAGLMLSSNYPYLGYRSTCKYSASRAVAKVTGYLSPGTNETNIKNMLYSRGPLAVALNATPLQYYTKGIINYSSTSCNPNTLNHAVTLVGYGTSNGLNYWIVKNSWGSTWGESGYFRIARDKGTCGINLVVLSSVIG